MRGRTALLALDFDAKIHGAAAVAADAQRAVNWIRECGGLVVTDRSTSAGRHVLVPLASGETHGRADIEPMLRLLAERLPTLDVTPMLNDATGCITPPGSLCREGGHRILDDTLDTALNAFTVRSDRGLVARLSAHLSGGITPASAKRPTPQPRHSSPGESDMWEGTGDDARLRSEWRLTTPLPSPVLAFATAGGLPFDGRWPTRHEARQSVLTQVALRGYCLADVLAHLPAAGGGWVGFSASYDRYGPGAERALRRDWTRACRWTSLHAPLFQVPGHKTSELTGGEVGRTVRRAASTSVHSVWLARSLAWTDANWPRSAHRSTVLAVLQALAHGAAVGGEVVDGVATVELGGRSLSLMAGLMPETTLFEVLAELRDISGSPILRVRRGAGQLADAYALVTPRINDRPVEPAPLDRVQVAPVHEAWSVLGLRHRRIYELITHTGISSPSEVFAAAHIGASSGYETLATLAQIGLITRDRGRIAPGERTLDDIAAAYGLHYVRAERIARHQRERKEWWTWLTLRFAAHHLDDTAHDDPWPNGLLDTPWDTADQADYLAAVMATGPPLDLAAPLRPSV
ncbi:hypothetical protein AB0M12_40345 [Nocardia vinacea]|uniref:hypothetical protein n=1 Tax=Nocardia vinacea TaxID=96468 RepID=UPI0034394A89